VVRGGRRVWRGGARTRLRGALGGALREDRLRLRHRADWGRSRLVQGRGRGDRPGVLGWGGRCRCSPPACRAQCGRLREDFAADLGKTLTTHTDLDQGEVATFREFLALTFNRSVMNGPHGVLQDDLAFVRPWGFEVAGIAAPTSLWHGDADDLVPASHSERLA